MGLVCELLVSGAITATYNINSGAAASPDRICRGAALTEAAESPVGTKVTGRLTENNVLIEGKSVTTERLPDKDNGLIQLKQTSQDGGNIERSLSAQALPALKKQLAADTTRSGP